MTVSLQGASEYTDLQSLNRVKYSKNVDPEETLTFVAKQFEAIFLQMMLKSAHGEGSEDALFDSEQTEFYQDWYDKQLAVHLSSGQGVGIADMLVQQLRTRKAMQDNSGVGAVVNSGMENIPQHAQPHSLPVKMSVSRLDQSDIHEQQGIKPTQQLGTPQAFIEHLWPLAQEAANKLGVAPEVLLAQAALETGWGKKVSQHANGKSSHNLFNIKADSRWDGEHVSVSTLEYRDGVAVREQAQFRAYSSFESSFSDYVSFLQNSPRYQNALSVAEDGGAYTRELARAGYATDPKYSSKIIGIVNGQPFQEALKSVKS